MKALRVIAMTSVLGATIWSSPAQAQWKTQIDAGAVAVPKGDLFVRNVDSLWTGGDEVLQNVSILIRDGMIRAIGADFDPPNGVTLVDGQGMHAIPGIVDEHSHIAMRGTNEGSAPVVPEVRVLDALDPEDFDIYRALSGGVTTAQILHGSANPIGGQSAIIKTRWGMDDSKQLLVQGAPQTVKFALGENVTRKRSNNPDRFPYSRAGVEAIYVEAFTAAQEYKETWEDYRQNPNRYPFPPRRDLRLEALVEIMDGRIRVHAHSYRSDEIVMLMRVAERFGFKIDVFTHVLEGYKIADEMAAHGAGGSTFSDWWQYKLEAYDAIPYNAAIMHEHGVLTSLNSDIPWLQSFMVYEFNKPVKYGGVSKYDALRMLTLNPARQLLIDDKVGSVEVGKQADIVLLSGDPFDVYSRVAKTIVDGIVYYDLEREEETRFERVRELPRVVDLIPNTTPSTTSRANDNGVAAANPVSRASSGSGSAGGALQGSVTVLTGATIHTVSGPVIERGTVVMTDGKITAVGAASQVSIPAGANVIDVAGKHVYPGMIDPWTQLGMVEIGSFAASRDDRELGRFNPHVNALYGIHPHSDAIPVARANGITTVQSNLASQGGTIIAGTGVVIQLMGDTQERMLVREGTSVLVDFPSPTGKDWDDPKLEGARLEELIDLFERATLYAAQPSVNDDPTQRFEVNLANREGLMLQALVPAVTGQVPTIFEVSAERDIKTLFLFLDKFPDVRAVLAGGNEAFRVADELAARNIPVVVGSSLRPTMNRDDPVTAGWRNAGILHSAGVTVAFGTGGVSDVRNLPYHAAKSAAFGLPKEEALKAVTINAAKVLGLDGELGSIDVGKRGDLIVTDGDPLQIVTNVERAFINGVEVSVESRHTRLWHEFRERH